MDETKNTESLDQLDKKIINTLQKNSRLSLRDISREVGHSVSTVQKRFNRILEEGYLSGFGALLNPQKFDFITALIGLKVGGGALVDVEAEIAKTNSACAVYDVTGEYDAFVVGKFKSRAELNDFVKKILSAKTVKETCTFVVLNTVKEDFRVYI